MYVSNYTTGRLTAHVSRAGSRYSFWQLSSLSGVHLKSADEPAFQCRSQSTICVCICCGCVVKGSWGCESASFPVSAVTFSVYRLPRKMWGWMQKLIFNQGGPLLRPGEVFDLLVTYLGWVPFKDFKIILTWLWSRLSVVYRGIPMMLAFLGELRTGVETPAAQQHVWATGRGEKEVMTRW